MKRALRIVFLGSLVSVIALAFARARLSNAGGSFLLSIGSDGSDGDLVVGANVTIDLAQAVTASWDAPSPSPGKGVYDPAKWAVVFKYRSVQINAGSVRFANHPSRAPVVWLVQNGAFIDGSVFVSGAAYQGLDAFPAEPGPGGFRGGYGYDVGSVIRSGGFGPGGGARVGVSNLGGGASHGTPGTGAGAGATYGEPSLLVLAGGSGGGGGSIDGRQNLFPGGSGGGAILIAVGGDLTLDGQIFADGGNQGGLNAGGSGGSIRLIASRVNGTGAMYARGGYGGSGTVGNGGDGIIHIDAFESTLRHGDPVYSFGLTGDPPQIWPPDAAPRVAVTRVRNVDIGAVNVPADPRARFDGAPNADVSVSTDKPVVVEISAQNVPANAAVTLRVVPRLQDDFVVPAAFAAGNVASSRWEAVFTPPHGIASLQARVDLP